MNIWKTSLLFTLFFVGLLFIIVAMSGMINESARAFVPANVQSKNVELVDHVGGAAKAVFVEGKYAYVGFGPQFAVMAISDPSEPVRVGYMLLPSMIEDIYVLGSYAYVLTNGTDLRIIDISNPLAPVEVGIYQGTSKIYEVVVADSRAYLAEEEGMRVLDISNAAAPSDVGFYDSGGRSITVAVNGDYAYLARPFGFGGLLHIINIADLALTQVAVYQTGGWSGLAVDVVGNYAYIAQVQPSGPYSSISMRIVDLSNPAMPAKMGYYNLGIYYNSSHIEVTVVGEVAYLFTERGMSMLDVSNPAEPTHAGDLYLAGPNEEMVVADNYGYIAGGPRGLRVVDLSNPAIPIKIGAYKALGIANDVVERDDYVYVADRGTNSWDASYFGSLNVIEVTQPTTARVVGFHPVTGAGGVAIANNHAYLGSGYCDYRRGLGCYGSLTVVDISSPVAPSEVGYSTSIWDDGDSSAFDELPGRVVVNDSYIYVTAPDGLHILDVATSTEMGLYDFEDIKDVVLADGYLWAAGKAGLRILEISNPITPTEVSRYETTGQTEGFTIANDRAYLADGNEGLQILDISDPFQPSQITSFQSDGFAKDVAVAHDYAFVASGEAGLRVLDVSNPALPKEVGFYDTPGDASAVAVEGRYVYVADGEGGLEILQFQHAISGQVMQANGMPFSGVAISASQGMSVTTDATGAYLFGYLSANSYTLMPSLDGYAFSPPVRTVAVPPDKSQEQFVILSAPISITLQPNIATSLTISDTQGLPTRLEFPASSVTLTTTLLLTPTLAADEPGFHFTGHAFELMAMQKGQKVPDFTFNAPVTITLDYSDDDVRLASNENDLALWWRSDNVWQDASQNCNPPTLYQRDLLNNQISVPICRISKFALFAPTNHRYLPLVFR